MTNAAAELKWNIGQYEDELLIRNHLDTADAHQKPGLRVKYAERNYAKLNDLRAQVQNDDLARHLRLFGMQPGCELEGLWYKARVERDWRKRLNRDLHLSDQREFQRRNKHRLDDLRALLHRDGELMEKARASNNRA